MYLKYTQIFRKLEECYDQVTHPQKRRPIRHILDGAMGRWEDDNVIRDIYLHCGQVVGAKTRNDGLRTA